MVLFALSTANRRTIYDDVEHPGILSSSTIRHRSSLYSLTAHGEWMGSDIPSLFFGEVEVRPYILCDWAFYLAPIVMKTCS